MNQCPPRLPRCAQFNTVYGQPKAYLTGVGLEDLSASGGSYRGRFHMDLTPFPGWEPKISFEDLVKEMVHADLEDAKKDELCQRAGFQVYNHNE